MTITSLYNIKAELKDFSDALEYVNKLDPLEIHELLEIFNDRGHCKANDLFSSKVVDPIMKIISTQQGLEAAQLRYIEFSNDMSVLAQVLILSLLHHAPSKYQKKSTEMIKFCMHHSSVGTQEEYLRQEYFHPFVKERFFQEEDKGIITACSKEAQDHLFKVLSEGLLLNLALYMYDITVSQQNTSVALMKRADETEVPYTRIEDEAIRAFCLEHEEEIHGSVLMLVPDLSGELLDELEVYCHKNGIPFDKEEEIRERSQVFRDSIAGLKREDYWTIFEQHANIMKIILDLRHLKPQDSENKLNIPET